MLNDGRKHSAIVIGLALVAVLLAGCSHSRPSPHAPMRVGMYAAARDLVESQVVDDMDDRRYMLDRMRAGVLNLDVGDPERAERWFAEVYDVLRMQGLNADKTVSSVVLTEGVKVWKGEPFEQAMALVYYGYVQASLGSWDNARAAAGNALFYLRDFDPEEEGEDERQIDTAEIARRAAQYEAQQRGDRTFDSFEDYLDHGYIVERNNFTMAYLLHGIASQQLGRDDEASDYFNQVLKLDRSLSPLVETLRSGQYNTIVVVADGLGPRKVATGPSGALSRYRPIDTERGPAALRVDGQAVASLPAVTNLNQMALDHRWNNLEDVRVAKSFLGDLAIAGGSIALIKAADERNGTLAIVGAGVLAVGLLMKGTAKANTDYCDVFPHRLFVAALEITQPGTAVEVDLPGFPPSRATLINLAPPAGPEAQFYYLRAPVQRDLANLFVPQPALEAEGSLP